MIQRMHYSLIGKTQVSFVLLDEDLPIDKDLGVAFNATSRGAESRTKRRSEPDRDDFQFLRVGNVISQVDASWDMVLLSQELEIVLNYADYQYVYNAAAGTRSTIYVLDLDWTWA